MESSTFVIEAKAMQQMYINMYIDRPLCTHPYAVTLQDCKSWNISYYQSSLDGGKLQLKNVFSRVVHYWHFTRFRAPP